MLVNVALSVFLLFFVDLLLSDRRVCLTSKWFQMNNPYTLKRCSGSGDKKFSVSGHVWYHLDRVSELTKIRKISAGSVGHKKLRSVKFSTPGARYASSQKS